MKNFISVFICFTFLCLITYSCGPNAEQIAKQKVQDSIYRVDSLITIQKQLAEKHIQDSIKLTTYNKGDTIIVKFKEAIMIMDATNAIDLNSVEEQSMSYNGKIRGTLRNGIGI